MQVPAYTDWDAHRSQLHTHKDAYNSTYLDNPRVSGRWICFGLSLPTSVLVDDQILLVIVPREEWGKAYYLKFGSMEAKQEDSSDVLK